MVSLDKAVVARFAKGEEHFEVLVDPENALLLREGGVVDLDTVLAIEEIFKDASKGEKASEESLRHTFSTTDPGAIAKRIITEGDLHLTAQQRRKIQEHKRKQVVAAIAANAINPQTGLPHPPQRIEKALEEAKVNIDPLKSVDEQVNVALKAIRPLIPIRFEEVNIAVKVPAIYAAKSQSSIQRFAKIVKQEWQKDGSWIGLVRFPAGLQNDFYELVNRLSRGEAETRLVAREGQK
ncbi:MAG TPA: ribosome assembly factor SBDS [Candidatus Bathyarchaeia archaeon]|nr:ribosome assembly factor SBDS [Candidatus Bathyarchaeia archaeon]